MIGNEGAESSLFILYVNHYEGYLLLLNPGTRSLSLCPDLYPHKDDFEL
jgi:hypothetical protein